MISEMDAPEKEIKLTDKQKRFCDEYLIDLNATQAAIRAGYSEDSARQIGTDTLSKTYIRKYIDEQLEIGMRQRKTELKTKVLDTLKEIAFTTETKTTDQLKALELLGKYTVLFNDTIDLNIPQNVNIVLNHKPVSKIEKDE